MKTFKQYLDNKGQRPFQFAKQHGLVSTTIWNAYKGKPLSGKMAVIIHKATGSNVAIQSLIAGFDAPQ